MSQDLQFRSLGTSLLMFQIDPSTVKFLTILLRLFLCAPLALGSQQLPEEAGHQGGGGAPRTRKKNILVFTGGARSGEAPEENHLAEVVRSKLGRRI